MKTDRQQNKKEVKTRTDKNELVQEMLRYMSVYALAWAPICAFCVCVRGGGVCERVCVSV